MFDQISVVRTWNKSISIACRDCLPNSIWSNGHVCKPSISDDPCYQLPIIEENKARQFFVSFRSLDISSNSIDSLLQSWALHERMYVYFDYNWGHRRSSNYHNRCELLSESPMLIDFVCMVCIQLGRINPLNNPYLHNVPAPERIDYQLYQMALQWQFLFYMPNIWMKTVRTCDTSQHLIEQSILQSIHHVHYHKWLWKVMKNKQNNR